MKGRESLIFKVDYARISDAFLTSLLFGEQRNRMFTNDDMKGDSSAYTRTRKVLLTVIGHTHMYCC